MSTKISHYLEKKSTRGETIALQQYAPLVKKLSSRYFQRHNARYELDDLIQVAALGLSDGYRSFNPTLGYKFITHAYNRINFALSRYVRANTGVVHIPYKKLSSEVEVPQRIVTRPGWEIPDMFDGLDRVELGEVLESALSVLTERQKTIVLAVYVQGNTAEEVAEDLEVSTSTIYTDLRMAMSAMKSFFEESGTSLDDLLGEGV